MVLAGLDIEKDNKSRIAVLEEGTRLAKLVEKVAKLEFEAGKTTTANVATVTAWSRGGNPALEGERS